MGQFESGSDIFVLLTFIYETTFNKFNYANSRVECCGEKLRKTYHRRNKIYFERIKKAGKTPLTFRLPQRFLCNLNLFRVKAM